MISIRSYAGRGTAIGETSTALARPMGPLAGFDNSSTAGDAHNCRLGDADPGRNRGGIEAVIPELDHTVSIAAAALHSGSLVRNQANQVEWVALGAKLGDLLVHPADLL